MKTVVGNAVAYSTYHIGIQSIETNAKRLDIWLSLFLLWLAVVAFSMQTSGAYHPYQLAIE